jgi:hypothetical protein
MTHTDQMMNLRAKVDQVLTVREPGQDRLSWKTGSICTITSPPVQRLPALGVEGRILVRLGHPTRPIYRTTTQTKIIATFHLSPRLLEQIHRNPNTQQSRR